MHKDLEEILFTEREVADRIRKMGREIAAYYKAQGVEKIIVVGVLKGAFIFMADLVRKVPLDTALDFVQVSSYGSGTVSNGKPVLKKDLSLDIKGSHVLIVEDIIDTGTTLTALKGILKERGPASIAICTLIDKPSRRKVELKPDFCGFEVPDKFIVGYGLDYNDRYRYLPYVGVLSANIYAK